MQRQVDEGGGEHREGDLAAFLSGFEELVTLYGERAAAFAQDADSRPLAGHYTSVLREQIRIISPAILNAYQETSDSVRGEADEFLRASAAVSLISGARNLLPRIASPFGLAALAAIFELIKKIIDFLVRILHIKFLEKWWPTISDLLDEILEALTGLFSSFGAMGLHRQQVAYLETQWHLERLVQLREGRTRSIDQST